MPGHVMYPKNAKTTNYINMVGVGDYGRCGWLLVSKKCNVNGRLK